MELILPVQAKANEASTLGYTGRMRQQLVELNDSKVKEPNFRQWYNEYFIPLLTKIDVAWGHASIIAKLGCLDGLDNRLPPYFNARLSDWKDGEILFPPDLHSGSKVAFTFNLDQNINITDVDEENLFGRKMAEVKRACENDTFWDGKIWPS